MSKKRLVHLLLRISQLIRIVKFKWLSSCPSAGHPVLHQPLQLVGNGAVVFGRNVNIGVFPSPYYLSSYAYIEARGPDARISIGDDTYINNGFVAIAEHASISIGKKVLIGSNVEIYDSDFHNLAPSERHRSDPNNASPVTIEDGVFLGSNVKILKGVQIGANSVVANGSIVIGDIPGNVIAAGIPAKVIRSIL